MSYPPPGSGSYPYGTFSAAGTYSYPGTGYSPWPYHHYNGYVPAAPVAQPPMARTPVPAPTPLTPTPAPRATNYASYTPKETNNAPSSSTTATGTGTGRSRKQGSTKGLFTKELKNLMYGFGDDRNPANDTVAVMEEILIEYIIDVCQTATGGARKQRLAIEDLRKALSHPADAKKLARMEELLFMQEDIKRARAQFEPDMK
ncbi:transcription initiation factor IID, 18kD subunit-domain-containing protein [Mycena floridula]|nr:transcription initiation factor IID, 18kD subunit-domain-containing protein [Mycena floridula]